MDVDVREGFEYPLAGDRTLRLLALGGGVPVVVNVVLLSGYAGAALGYDPARWVALAGLAAWVPVWVAWLGYYVRVVRRTATGEAGPPRFDGWLAVARDGVVCSLLGVGYLLPLVVLNVGILLLVGVAAGGMFAAVSEGTPGGLAAAGVLYLLASVVGTVLTFGYAVLAAYLYPVSLTAYAHGGVRAALSPRQLWPVVTSPNYAMPWLLVAGVSTFLWFALAMAVSLLVGYLLLPLAPLAGFYLLVVAGRLFGVAAVLESDASDRDAPTIADL
jgi:hypothetical protein